MHAAAADWVQRWAPTDPVRVLDIGGRNVNGTPAGAFHPDSVFTVVDKLAGENVDWVGDILDYTSVDLFNVVCHLEVAEHSPDWAMHLGYARDLLADGGVLIFTAAGHGRAPHSAVDGLTVRPGEHYENVDAVHLARVLAAAFSSHVVDVAGEDVRATAWR